MYLYEIATLISNVLITIVLFKIQSLTHLATCKQKYNRLVNVVQAYQPPVNNTNQATAVDWSAGIWTKAY